MEICIRLCKRKENEMLIVKIIILLWVITGVILGVAFCYADESEGVFDDIHGLNLIIIALSIIVIGPPIFIYSAIKHYMKRR